MNTDVIQVWRVGLEGFPGGFAEFRRILSPDETARAQRFHFERDRRRFTVTRAALRCILGKRLQQSPESLTFRYGNHGKPALADPEASLRFNVSHSHELALIAIAEGREVGVDVEFQRAMNDLERLLTANFSAREIAEFQAVPAADRPATFFAGWTRKEAYLKALGGGLAVPLHRFSVTLTPGRPAELLETLDDPAARDRWSMVELPVPTGYAGALVAEGKDWRCECADWAP